MNAAKIPTAERQDRKAIIAQQAARLSDLLQEIYGRNRFYTRKFDEAGLRPGALSFPKDLQRLPLTAKAELSAEFEEIAAISRKRFSDVARYSSR